MTTSRSDPMKLAIDKIITEGLQVRAGTDLATVADYAEQMQAGVEFPPILVFQSERDYFLGDGMHRILGAQKAGILGIDTEVRKGTKKIALWYAAGANQAHGLRRTTADKQRAVETALKVNGRLSDRVIAEHCGVDATMVKAARERGGIDTPATIIGKDGREYKRRPVPPPKPKAPPAAEEETPRVKVEEQIVDSVGRVVPPGVMELWNRRDEARALLKQVSVVRVKVRELQEAGDPLYAEVMFSSVLAHLDQVYSGLGVGDPYAVCPSCQGKVQATCRMCNKRGLISKFRWDTAVPSELKAAITKQVAKAKRE